MPDAETMDAISKLHEVDAVFREVCDLLFDGAVDPREAYDVSKASPDGSELHVNSARLRKACKTCKKGKCSCVSKRERTKAERERLQARVSELDLEVHEDEFQFWRRYEKVKRR